jgi:hypothetical protein
MTGEDIQKFITALRLTPDSFAGKVGLPATKIRRLINKDRSKEVTDINILQAIYIGGLQAVEHRMQQLSVQAKNIESFKTLFEELENAMKAHTAAQKFAERFEEKNEAEQ